VGRRPRIFWIGCALLAGFIAVSTLAPVIAPYDPLRPVGPPLSSPAREHLLGTNDIGQDIFSQVVYGTRSSVLVAMAITALSTMLSWMIGLVSGFVRQLEGLLMGCTDLLLALPDLPLVLLVLTLVGPSRLSVVLVLAFLSWPAFARVVSAVVIVARSSVYVEASRSIGAPSGHVMLRHLLPATLDVLPTKLVLTMRYAVFAESTLAFLGLGAGGTVSWGWMLNVAFRDPLLFSRSMWPWLVLPPAIAIAALILATVWIGTGITGKRTREASSERNARFSVR